jgi:hypothetical protein
MDVEQHTSEMILYIQYLKILDKYVRSNETTCVVVYILICWSRLSSWSNGYIGIDALIKVYVKAKAFSVWGGTILRWTGEPTPKIIGMSSELYVLHWIEK